MPRACAIKSSPFNHYNFIAPRYVTRRYTGWLGLRAASHYKRLAATNFAKLWRSRRRVTQSWKRALISSVRDVQRRRGWRRRPPFCQPSYRIRTPVGYEAISFKSSKLATRARLRREAHGDAASLRTSKLILSDMKFRLRAAIFFHCGYTHTAAAWRAPPKGPK